jgi:hypothetical protein
MSKQLRQSKKKKNKNNYECFNGYKFDDNAYHCKTCGRFAKCNLDKNNELIKQIQEKQLNYGDDY